MCVQWPEAEQSSRLACHKRGLIVCAYAFCFCARVYLCIHGMFMQTCSVYNTRVYICACMYHVVLECTTHTYIHTFPCVCMYVCVQAYIFSAKRNQQETQYMGAMHECCACMYACLMCISML